MANATLTSRLGRRCGFVVAMAILPAACAPLVEYTDGLRNSKDYTIIVRGTAQFGGFLGVLAGIPVVIAALPVTYPIYYVQQSDDPESADFTSTVLFPSFVLLEVGSLLATPVELAEFAVYGAWLPPDTPTDEEQEEFEQKIDHDTLPRYPVTPIYPPASKVPRNGG